MAPDIAALDDVPGIDMTEITRQLDITKTGVFLGKNAAFLGPLMCSMDFLWTEGLPTAATDGTTIWWNPHWFLSLEPDTRKTVLVHELMHVALLHCVRRGDRDPRVWNQAGDIHINNQLEREGFSFVGVEKCWKDSAFGEQPTEDIYDALIKQQQDKKCAPWGPDGEPGDGDEDGEGQLDLFPGDPEKKRQIINSVVQAAHSARLNNQGGTIPGETEVFLKDFLDPKLPWEQLLYRWFSDLGSEDYSWARPNRRYSDIYLPSRVQDNDRLEHLAYYLDVSGSISDHDVLRFNSEVKYIKDTFNPQKLTLVQFDTRISSVIEITEDEQFDGIRIIGRGGTAWEPVRKHIERIQPTCAVIFTDLGFWDPITRLNQDIPVLWIVNHDLSQAPFGKTIHIKE